MTDQRLDLMNDYFLDQMLDAYEKREEELYEEMMNDESQFEDDDAN